MPIHRVLLVAHGEKALAALPLVQEELAKRGVDTSLVSEGIKILPDLVLCLGGDGTLLRASDWAAEHDIPIMGINYGTLGFLTAFTSEELVQALDVVALGEFREELRTRIKMEWFREGNLNTSEYALNDVVIKHGTVPRLLNMELRIDGDCASTYRADGLIVSTPTGATAYNFAAGGPFLHARSKAFVVTPICPHSVAHRPIVVGADLPIEIKYLGPEDREAFVTVDGHLLGSGGSSLAAECLKDSGLLPGDTLRISGDCKPLRLCPSTHNIFDIMRAKVGWNS